MKNGKKDGFRFLFAPLDTDEYYAWSSDLEEIPNGQGL